VKPGPESLLKILLGAHVFFPGHSAGTEILTLELARGLRMRGHRVDIVAGEREERVPERSTPWMTEDRYDDFPVHRLHYGVGKLRDPISHHLDSPRRVSLVRHLVSRLKPDVVHFNHLFGFSAQVIPEIRGMGIPVIFTPTDYWVACPKSILYRTYDKQICDGPGKDAVDCLFCLLPVPKWAGKLAWKMAASTHRNPMGPLASLHSLTKRSTFIAECVNAADKVLPATNFLAGILVRHGVDANRLRVVPYGVDVGNLPERIPVPHGFSEENPLRLGFIGQISEIKGIHLLLEALTLLRDKRDLVTLHIYGKQDQEDPYYRRLQKTAREMIDNQVLFHGTFPHGNIGEILRSMHFLVVPSLWYESTPLVLCSALSAGIPVLVSRLGGMTEIVEEGVDGFSFPAGDAKELSATISNLLDNPGMIHQIRKNMKIRNRSVSDYVRDVESEYLSLPRKRVSNSP
jgi:glycosyltransferase involved in cell wall biosynthesis